NRKQSQFVSALISETWIARRRIERISLSVKILRADVQWLMNVTEVMNQENQRHRFRDRARIVLRLVALQYSDTERDHVHDIELRFDRCIFCDPPIGNRSDQTMSARSITKASAGKQVHC